MKNPQELRQRHAALVQQMTDLYKTASDENRGLSAEERTKFDKMKGDADVLAQEIKDVEFLIAADAEAGKRNLGKDGAKMYENFDLLRSFRAHLNGQEQKGADAEVQSYLRSVMSGNRSAKGDSFLIPTFVPDELRGDVLFGGGTGTGSDVVVKQIDQFIATLRAKLVMAKLGATTMFGLTDYRSIPYFSTAGVAYWNGEIGTKTESSQDMASLTLTPKSLIALTSVSKQLLIQHGGIQQILFDDMTSAIAAEWESAALVGTGGNMPMGLMVSTLITDGTAFGASTNGGSLTWAGVNELIALVDDGNVEGTGFLTSPTGIKQARTILASGTNSADRFISEMMRVEGMRVEYTTNMPSTFVKGASSTCTGMIYGNWSDLILAQWGPIEVMVDPYSGSKYGRIFLNVDTFVDVIWKRNASFARNKTILK